MIFEKIPVLDHGYVQLIETWGSDHAIIEAARMSTDKGFLGWGPHTKPCPNAQWEIRQFANQIGTLIEQCFPRTWDLFLERLNRA
jgi:hypothetical protein